jgi:hypothetical protein
VKRLDITIIILFMVFTMACKQSSEMPAREGSGSTSGTTQSASASPQQSTTSPVPVAEPGEAAPLMAPESVTASGVNPPHGQPNHRCDIAVGAPLNSPKATQYGTPLTSPLNVPAQTSTPSTAPGMNPPHGQPNHRCDIAVGAPLDSPPGKLTPPVTSPLNVPAQAGTPSTAPGMNPPHGQPNHRCDIAVGAPLDSPPAKPK